MKNVAVSSCANYTDLYLKEVKESNKTLKDFVTSELKSLGDFTGKEFNKIFSRQLKLFTLDKNKGKMANIQHINNFQIVLREEIIKSVTKVVDNKFTALNSSFYLDVRDDYVENFRLDLEAFSDEFIGEICEFFEECNGHSIRKKNGPRRFNKPGKLSPGNVYVEVQQSLDDKLEDTLHLASTSGKSVQTSRLGKSVIRAFDQRKYSYVDVTRTTIQTMKRPVNA